MANGLSQLVESLSIKYLLIGPSANFTSGTVSGRRRRSYSRGPVCFSSDHPSNCAAAVADMVLQGMELYIFSTMVPIGDKSQPWFDASYNLAAFIKREAYQIWAEALVTKDPNVKCLTSSEHIAKIGEKFESYLCGTHQFWALSKAALGNLIQPSLSPLRTGNDILVHTAKEKADLQGAPFASNSTLDDQGITPLTILRCQTSMPKERHWFRSI